MAWCGQQVGVCVCVCVCGQRRAGAVVGSTQSAGERKGAQAWWAGEAVEGAREGCSSVRGGIAELQLWGEGKTSNGEE